MCMRTNIVLDDDIINEARQYSHSSTKRALVEEALKVFIETKARERKTHTYRVRLLNLETRLSGIQLRERPLSVLKESRERS